MGRTGIRAMFGSSNARAYGRAPRRWRLDVSFGRFAGLEPAVRARLAQQPVRYEPMTVILPEDHRPAGSAAVPLAELAGERVYAGAGNPRTPEWTRCGGPPPSWRGRKYGCHIRRTGGFRSQMHSS